MCTKRLCARPVDDFIGEPREPTGVRPFLRLAAVSSALVGAVLLVVGYGREHRDLRRLYFLGIGWLALIVAVLTIVAGIVASRRLVRR